jgi:hypothetical protein
MKSSIRLTRPVKNPLPNGLKNANPILPCALQRGFRQVVLVRHTGNISRFPAAELCQKQ